MYQNINFFKTQYLEEKPKESKKSNYSLEPALNNILHAVHSQLKYNPKPSVPKIPKPIADTMAQKQPMVFLTGSKNKQHRRSLGSRTIPQLQADMEFHKNKIVQGKTSDAMNYQNQQRYREVLRQKRILENMLQEHHKLQSDRDNIANEISYMRSYLDNIRNRLDVSLRKLNMQKNVVNQPCCHKKLRLPSRNKTDTLSEKTSKATLLKKQVKYARISAGGQTGTQPLPKIASSSARQPSAVSAKKVVTNVFPTKKRGKQWVYCTRIDRKNEVTSLI